MKCPKQRSSVQHLVIISDANSKIIFLFHVLITLGTTLSLFRAHLKIPSAVSFYPDTRTMTSSQEPAWGGWLARARTPRKASWHPKPGMFSRNTTSLWRRPKPFSRCAEREEEAILLQREEEEEEVIICKKTKKTNHKHWDHPKDFLNCFGCCSSLIHCRFHGSVLWQHFYMFGLKKERELACERYILSIQYCKYRKLNCFISKLCHLCSCTLPRIHNHWYNWMKDDI